MSLIKEAVAVLQAGELVALPTETVYGLAGDAKNPRSLEKIFALKNRPKTNPLIVHLASIEMIGEFAQSVPQDAIQVARAFWPGPLTLLLKKQSSVLDLLTAGQDTVALRIPNHPLALALLRAFGGGLAAPSANRFKGISPTTAQHVENEFKAELGTKLPLILDGGPCTVGIESTIVSFLGKSPVILRQGAITASMLSDVLGKKLEPDDALNPTNIVVPGSFEKHYAPKKPLYLEEAASFTERLNYFVSKKNSIGVLSFSKKPDSFKEGQGVWIEMESCPKVYAHNLYGFLRDLDSTKIDCILVEKPENSENWGAILDRLQRASSLLERI